MHVDQLREFVVFTRYLNFTKAAAALNMTQSNLSKRIRLLENELGFDLVGRGKKLSLTAAGSHFLNKSDHILNELEAVVEECRHIALSTVGDLLVQDPPYNDNAAREYYRFLEAFREEHPEIPLKFTRVRHGEPKENLIQGDVDLSLIYNFGLPDILVRHYEENGFVARSLCSQPLVVWCTIDHPHASKESLSLKDLKGTKVMTSNGTYSPLRYALSDLFAHYKIPLQFNIHNTTLQSEFFFAEASDSVYILPEQMRNDARLRVRRNMRFVPLDKDEITVKAFAVAYCGSNKKRQPLQMLFRALSRSSPEADLAS